MTVPINLGQLPTRKWAISEAGLKESLREGGFVGVNDINITTPIINMAAAINIIIFENLFWSILFTTLASGIKILLHLNCIIIQT